MDIGAAGIIADPNAGNFMNYLSMMTGDAFNYGTIFAMSITPYINSSIIMQLLTVAIPALERLSKDGEEGRKKIAAITRYVAVALGLLQSTAYYFYLRNTKTNGVKLPAEGSRDRRGFHRRLGGISGHYHYPCIDGWHRINHVARRADQ